MSRIKNTRVENPLIGIPWMSSLSWVRRHLSKPRQVWSLRRGKIESLTPPGILKCQKGFLEKSPCKLTKGTNTRNIFPTFQFAKFLCIFVGKTRTSLISLLQVAAILPHLLILWLMERWLLWRIKVAVDLVLPSHLLLLLKPVCWCKMLHLTDWTWASRL